MIPWVAGTVGVGLRLQLLLDTQGLIVAGRGKAIK
jgi:hypothetical protein